MATIITLVFFIAAVVVFGRLLLKAPFFSETPQQEQLYSKRMYGLEFSCYILSFFAILLPFNTDKPLEEREKNHKSFEKAVDAMIDDEFSEVLGDN